MATKQSALEKKRSQPTVAAKPAALKKKVKRDKTVEVKLREPSEEEKRARVLAAFTTPPEEVLKNFRKVSKEKRKEAEASKPKKGSTANFLAKPPSKGKKYSLDLRIHTPGTVGYFVSGGINPGPALSRLAKVKGLDIIGLTDFYDASLIDEIVSRSKDAEISILPGLDLRCEVAGCNEVYFTALFREGTTGAHIEAVLEDLQVPNTARGKKNFILGNTVDAIIAAVESRGGVVIPSRIDKTPFRQLAIPALVERYGFRTFDLVHPENMEYFKERWPDGGFTFLSFSNADALAQIGTRMATVKLSNGGFEGLKELVQRKVS